MEQTRSAARENTVSREAGSCVSHGLNVIHVKRQSLLAVLAAVYVEPKALCLLRD
jgi:hypothetical protein